MRRGLDSTLVSSVRTPAISSSLGAWTGACEPMSQRAGHEIGCFITAREELGRLPRSTFLTRAGEQRW